MKGNGFKIGVAAFFLLLSGYYLYPSFQALLINRQLDAMTEEERIVYEQENFAHIRNVQERALKLGLDLQGGMHVTLEVRVDALLDALATDKDQQFEEVLAAARQRADAENLNVIDAFVREFEARDPDARLSRYFRSPDRDITRRSSNAEVVGFLNREADLAVDRAISIIRDRVDRFGVTEPSIQKQGTRRIVVELPGVDDPDRMRDLLRGTARLEFRLMADPAELAQSVERIINHFDQQSPVDTAQAAPEDGEELPEVAAEEDQVDTPDTANQVISPLFDEPAASGNPFLEVIQPVGQGVIFGAVSERDTVVANRLLADPEVRRLLPRGVTLMYSANPEGRTADGFGLYYLLGVRQEVELTGEVITDARVDFDQFTNRPEVTMAMNSEGARIWARVTGANINRNIAIVMDDVVYSYPNVISRIVGGRSSITGLASSDEANDIVTLLRSGALPAPVDIVEDRMVGPSLGASAIRAGSISTVVGLFFVIIFMIFYYRTAGIVADIALLLNIIFIFGILAGFGATLTLPGIAGIVLTIGMAVDANVLIFERVREELATGKTLKAAIDAGYAKALSAIADANITTFFVAVILFSFGVGPIQGFAVTLMAGILSSLFTAIIVTRIFFDWMVTEKRLAVSYG